VVLNAGDNVGYGDAPAQCVEFLCAHPQILCVQGNYDKNVARFPDKQEEFRKKWGKTRPEKFAALYQDSASLSEEARAWLRGLPQELALTLGETSVLLTHYAPGVKEGLGTWTSDMRLKELARDTEAQVVICGHTHTPFVRRVGGVLWVNPGSVGRGGNCRACYAVLTLHSDAPPQAQLYQEAIL
jgi:putative phosphoesterase